MKVSITFVITLVFASQAYYQLTQQQQDSARQRQVMDNIRKLTEEDRKELRMTDSNHIDL